MRSPAVFHRSSATRAPITDHDGAIQILTTAKAVHRGSLFVEVATVHNRKAYLRVRVSVQALIVTWRPEHDNTT
jgi:hypothetical protein